MMIVRIRARYIIIIVKSEVWSICDCLGLGHGTMMYAVWRFIFQFMITKRYPTLQISFIGYHMCDQVVYDTRVGGFEYIKTCFAIRASVLIHDDPPIMKPHRCVAYELTSTRSISLDSKAIYGPTTPVIKEKFPGEWAVAKALLS